MTTRSRVTAANIAVRFAGDMGDGIHLAGDQLNRTSAAMGNSVFSLPDFPAEIRAPAGTMSGVTSYQVNFGERALTPGDRVGVLVAMNASALRAHLPEVELGGIIIVNTDAFIASEWIKAGYDHDPLLDGTLAGYKVIRCPAQTLNREATSGLRIAPREAERSKTFVILGLIYWLFDRSTEPTLHWMQNRFAAAVDVLKANKRSLKAGWEFGKSLSEVLPGYRVNAKTYAPGCYRRINGSMAIALGLATAAARSGRDAHCAAAPVPMACELLHQLIDHPMPRVKAVPADDDAAAVGMALGASYGGGLGVVLTAGTGLTNAAELIGLAVSVELPLIVIHSQHVGPAMGMPGRPEQADLMQAIFGRNGECPLPVLAMRTPADGFEIILEAARIATRYMTPVIVLTDVYLMRAIESWRVADVESLPKIEIPNLNSYADYSPKKPMLAYSRDVHLARPWIVPGTPGLEHRLSGLEKEDGTGAVSYEPADHEHMVHVRAQKISQIAGDIPRLQIEGPIDCDTLLVGWGSTYGAIATAADNLRHRKYSVASAHLRYVNPLPENTDEVLRRFRRVVVAEMNGCQLRMLLAAQLGITVESLTKMQGKPFSAAEIEDAVVNGRPVASSGVEL